MVAYSFKRRFSEPILAGTKDQTIRGNRRRHARVGEQLQLYTGMRTKQCRLIARATCLAIDPVRLTFSRRLGPLTFEVAGVILASGEMEAFAQADGFGESGYAVLDMAEFWFEQHGRGVDDIDFHGVRICWRPPGEITNVARRQRGSN